MKLVTAAARCALALGVAMLSAPPCHAAEFVAQPIAVPITTATRIGDPLRLPNGEMLVREFGLRDDIRDHSRWLRYREDGQLLDASAPHYPGRLRRLRGGEFLALPDTLEGAAPSRARCLAYVTDLNAAPRWIEAFQTCGRYVEDASGRLWSQAPYAPLARILPDGSQGTTFSPWQRYPSPTTYISAFVGREDGAGVVAAIGDRIDADTLDIVKFDQTLLDLAHFVPATASDERLQIEALLAQPDGSLYVFGISRAPAPLANRLYVAHLDSALIPHWEQRHAMPALDRIVAVHRYPDGLLTVLAPQSVATIAADGNLLNATSTTARVVGDRHSFVRARDGSHWAYFNQKRVEAPGESAVMLGTAWPLDGSDAIVDLGVGEFLGSIAHSDGGELVFGGRARDHAVLFDGGQPQAQLALQPAAALPDNNRNIIASRRLADGDSVLVIDDLLLTYAVRIDSTGNERWRRSIDTRPASVTSAFPVRNLTWVDDSHLCTISTLDLHCISLATGEQTLLLSSMLEAGQAVWMQAADGKLDLLTGSSRPPARWRRISMSGRVEMDRQVDVAPTHTLHRWSDHSWLLLDPNGPALKRVQSDGSIVWSWSPRFAYGIGDVRADADRVYAISYSDFLHSSLHFIDARIGGERAPPQAMDSFKPVSLVHSPAGVGVFSSGPAFNLDHQVGGSIDWRAFGVDGEALAARGWRCPGACTPVGTPMLRGDRLDLLAVTTPPFASFALTALTLQPALAARQLPRAAGGAFTGVFVAANDTNRGHVFDYIDSTDTLFAARFADDDQVRTDMRALRWETMQGVLDGDHDEWEVTRYQTTGGEFGAAQGARTLALGPAVLRFDGCDHAELSEYHNTPDATYVSISQLRRNGARAWPCPLQDGSTLPAEVTRPAHGGFDSRQSGAWVSPQAPKEGLMLAIQPATADSDGVFFAPWFTYWPGIEVGVYSSTTWFTLQGNIPSDADQGVDLTIYRATAGAHGPIRASATHRVGTATWTLADCEHARLHYRFDDLENLNSFRGLSGELSFERPGACSGGP